MVSFVHAFLLALLLTACSTPRTLPGSASGEPKSWQVSASGEPLQSVTEALLGYAATDFRSHKPVIDRVRDLRVGYVLTAAGKKQYLMCGEFHPMLSAPARGEWTTFATIQTDPYEQWLGGQAESWCKNAKVRWEVDQPNLSSALQQKLSSQN